MKNKRAGSLGRRLARWLALLTLAGLALTCLGVYTVTVLSFQDRQNDTLRQQQIQVSHLIAEVGGLDYPTLAHKLDDAMVGRRWLRRGATSLSVKRWFGSEGVFPSVRSGPPYSKRDFRGVEGTRGLRRELPRPDAKAHLGAALPVNESFVLPDRIAQRHADFSS